MVNKNQIYISKQKDKCDVTAIITKNQFQIVTSTNKYGQQKLKPIEIENLMIKWLNLIDVTKQFGITVCPEKHVHFTNKVINIFFLDIAVQNTYTYD